MTHLHKRWCTYDFEVDMCQNTEKMFLSPQPLTVILAFLLLFCSSNQLGAFDLEAVFSPLFWVEFPTNLLLFQVCSRPLLC